MYSTCIHCQRDLGRNTLIEALPVGRRIAFDEATGRLWVVCPACARWNLVPFESRWEAIEAGETLYRSTSQRMSTGEIGLAKTSEGTELVRVGTPLRPEMAAWRYGAQLVQRRWKYARTGVPVSLALVLIANPQLVLGPVGASSLAATTLGLLLGPVLRRRWGHARTRAMLQTHGGPAVITASTVHSASLQRLPGGGMRLWLPIVRQPIEHVSIARQLIAPLHSVASYFRSSGEITTSVSVDAPTHYSQLDDAEMIPALRVMLPVLNEAGASQRSVAAATALLTHSSPNLESILGDTAWYSDVAGRAGLDLLPIPRRSTRIDRLRAGKCSAGSVRQSHLLGHSSHAVRSWRSHAPRTTQMQSAVLFPGCALWALNAHANAEARPVPLRHRCARTNHHRSTVSARAASPTLPSRRLPIAPPVAHATAGREAALRCRRRQGSYGSAHARRRVCDPHWRATARP